MQKITVEQTRKGSGCWRAYFGSEWKPEEPIEYSYSANSVLTSLAISNAERFGLEYKRASWESIEEAIGRILRANPEKFGVVVDVKEKE